MVTPEAAMAAQAGKALIERAAKYACDMGTLYGLYVAALTGHLSFIQDPEKFIEDMQQITWNAVRGEPTE